MADPPLIQRPTAAEPVLAMLFTVTDLGRARHEVEAVSRRSGLDDDQLEDWVTAVNELMINAVRHGGGRGTVSLRLLNDQLTCEVSDQGAGFDTAAYVTRSERPPLSGTGGMGLWMVGQMSEFLLVDSGGAGTTIGITPRTREAAS